MMRIQPFCLLDVVVQPLGGVGATLGEEHFGLGALACLARTVHLGIDAQ